MKGGVLVSLHPDNPDIQTEIIKAVSQELITLAKRKHLVGSKTEETQKITKYRWDAFDVILWWESAGIERNIHCYLTGGYGNYTLVIEVNAWKDTEATFARKWTCRTVTSIPAFDHKNPLKMRGLRRKLTQAYTTVSIFNESDLAETAPLH